MKSMDLIMQCPYIRFKLIDSELFTKEFLDYTQKVRSDEQTNTEREQEISRREKALERRLDHLKNEKTKTRETGEIRNSNAVF
jgi:type II secretory pathway component PulJ